MVVQLPVTCAVLEQRQADGRQHHQRRHRRRFHQSAPLAGLAERRQKEQDHAQEQKNGFIRPGEQMDRQAEAQPDRVARARPGGAAGAALQTPGNRPRRRPRRPNRCSSTR